VSANVWTDVRAFYDAVGTAPWVRGDRPSRLASNALDVLRSATDHGLNPQDYREPAIATDLEALSRADAGAADHHAKLAAFDVRVTTALLSLGRDTALGRVQPTSLSGSWKARRTPPALPATLAHAVERSLDRWLAEIAPVHPEYAALQRALKQLYEEQESGGAAPAAAGSKTSRASSRTEAPTALTVEERITKVRLNLDRWRWMPDDFGARHFFINIPSYHLVAREQGAATFDTRVIVGKPATPTPVFSATMTTVVFSPYWNIPDTIVVGETAPAVLRDPAYLQRNQIEILRDGVRVDPGSVNWSDPEELKSLAFRQRPGAQNALGHVKFLFPNPFNVYLHDTPADELFERPGRAFSHGCVRVQEPQALAEYVLRGDADWSSDRIAQAMRAGTERQVKLREAIPVHFVYFTAWVDASGALQFGPDLYGYDTRQARR
jgi:murein L,D-transpeptidase YcbB/YkuD